MTSFVPLGGLQATEDRVATRSFALGPTALAAHVVEQWQQRGPEHQGAVLGRLGGWTGLERTLRVRIHEGLDATDTVDLGLRRRCFGANALVRRSPPSANRKWCCDGNRTGDQRAVPIVALQVVVAVVVSVVATNLTERLVMVGLCLLVVVFGWHTERRKRHRFDLLQSLSADAPVRVRRSRTLSTIPRADVVVGDVAVIEAGDIVPADGVVATDHGLLQVDESNLTGESTAVVKAEGDVVCAGTAVVEGRGILLVLCVGKHTVEGQCLTSTQDTVDDARAYARKDPDQPQDGGPVSPKYQGAAARERVQQRILYAGLGSSGLVLIILLAACWYHKAPTAEIIQALVLAVSLIAVASPDGLELSHIGAQTTATRQLLRDEILIRNVDALEAAGEITVLCTDKTGTLTMNRMTVVRADVAAASVTPEQMTSRLHPSLIRLMTTSIAVNSTADLPMPHEDPSALVSSTRGESERALLRLITEHMGCDYRAIRREAAVVRMLPFTSERRRMSTLHRTSRSRMQLLCKGAVDVVVQRCSHRCAVDGTRQVLPIDERMASGAPADARRLLCLAYRDIDLDSDDFRNVDIAHVDPSSLETDLTLLAIIALDDPVRLEAPEAIAQCKSLGMHVCMVTGDHISTAAGVARECGIISIEDEDDLESGMMGGSMMEGIVFREFVTDHNGKIIQSAFDRVWPRLRVLARATPLDKHLLVRGLMSSAAYGRQVVAVTGDGANDVAALKAAHVGLSLGRCGTEVAKRAADAVLLNDSLLSLLLVVAWGRRMRVCLALCMEFQLTTMVALIALSVASSLAWNELPFTGTQVILMSILMSGLVSIGLVSGVVCHPTTSEARHSLELPVLRGITLPGCWSRVGARSITALIVMLGVRLLHPIISDAPDVPSPTTICDGVFNDCPPIARGHPEVLAPTSASTGIIFFAFASCLLWLQLGFFLFQRRHRLRDRTRPPLTWFLQVLPLGIAMGLHLDAPALSVAEWLVCVFFGASLLVIDTCMWTRMEREG